MPEEFDENLVIDKYKSLIAVNEAYIKVPLNNAYQICQKKLNSNDLKLLKKALHNNLDIVGICNGNTKPVLYIDIKKIDKDLANYLYKFSKYLYTDVLKLKAFTDLFGKLKDHYLEFSTANGLKSKRCPFCGSSRMLNEYNTKKEAYDHFLPKEQYPFISIHFMNLVPMCHTCNSSYKARKNPIDILRSGVQKKVFYPFFNYGKINFELNISNLNLAIINPAEITIFNTLDGNSDEVQSWEEIFGIQERHKSIYVGDSFNWFEEVRIATNEFGDSYNTYKSNLNNNYYSNENFMKLSLLEACEKIGLI
ncbi:hypothetical protein DNC80_15365 [Flavobacterium sp. SOK18b]|nr:hypothetical protein [Flavobacterium sp. SOK18b]